METTRPRILLVEPDPQLIDLISRQSLQPLGYQTEVVSDVSQAIQLVHRFSPDLIIIDLNLQGLSGKDLMVALTSRGHHVPTIVIANKGQEADIIQAFRLGAKDYLLMPARDVEIVSVVENILHQVLEERSRLELEEKNDATIQSLHQNIHDLRTLIAIGKELVATRDPAELFTKLVESALYLARANFGWLMLRDKISYHYDLVDSRHLPELWLTRFGGQLVEGFSEFSFPSGKPVLIQDSLAKKLALDLLGVQSLIAPILIDQNVIGILGIVWMENELFGEDRQALMQILADYAACSIGGLNSTPMMEDAIDLKGKVN